MKKRIIFILALILLLTGCGEKEEKAATTTEATYQITTEAITEETTDEKDNPDYYKNLMFDAYYEYPKDLRDIISGISAYDVNGKFTAIIEIGDAGRMGEVAEYVTKTIDDIAGDFSSYDVMISYSDIKGWVCSWHSYDNKTGILINTLTNYTEENVTIEDLKKWNSGEKSTEE